METRNLNRLVFHRMPVYLLLIASCLLFLIPLYVVVITALKDFKDVSPNQMWDLPVSVSFGAIVKAAEKLGPNLLNSFILTIPAAAISAVIGSINGYIFAKWKFKYSEIIYIAMLFGMFIPYQSVLIPLVQFLSAIHLAGNLGGLILVHIIYGIPICSLIFRNYYEDIPNSLLEAGGMDGLGMMGIYIRIVLPLALPTFVVVLIWQVTSIWNEFLFAVTITQNPQVQPITVALQNLAGSQIVEWNVQMAGSFLAALPTILVYVFLGRYFMRGLLAGSVKE